MRLVETFLYPFIVTSHLTVTVTATRCSGACGGQAPPRGAPSGGCGGRAAVAGRFPSAGRGPCGLPGPAPRPPRRPHTAAPGLRRWEAQRAPHAPPAARGRAARGAEPSFRRPEARLNCGGRDPLSPDRGSQRLRSRSGGARRGHPRARRGRGRRPPPHGAAAGSRCPAAARRLLLPGRRPTRRPGGRERVQPRPAALPGAARPHQPRAAAPSAAGGRELTHAPLCVPASRLRDVTATARCGVTPRGKAVLRVGGLPPPPRLHTAQAQCRRRARGAGGKRRALLRGR